MAALAPRPLRLAALVVALLLLGVTAGAGSPAGAQQPSPDRSPQGEAPAALAERGAGSVLLVTGDRVTYRVDADGAIGLAVDPAPRQGPEPSFATWQDGDDLYVVPSDAAPLLGAPFDLDLFDVALLAEAGYTDAVGVIVEERGPGTFSDVSGLAVTADLESIDAVAARISGDAAAQAWSGDRDEVAAAYGGATRVWLDAPIRGGLDHSAEQVGAPVAWDAGLGGDGVRIAVLDTGIDEDHPDLDEGKVVAERDFTIDDDPDVLLPHGSHVAGIAAGTGDASDGDRRGMAPEALLLDGKVLRGQGSGTGLSSWFIEGMEWAVDEGAQIVNMSIVSDPDEGDGPTSRAIDALRAEHGTFFAVSAGNMGNAESSTVTAPATADGAVAVGSVDPDDSLSAFSSIGPRLGDFAIKPELTAPGGSIESARQGTDEYVTMSGTSMAAPHVAGTAALLLEQHPDWTADELEAALVSTAAPQEGQSVYEQGGGRLDVAAAVGAEVVASPAPLDLGFQPFPQGDETVTETVTFTNLTAAEVPLDLSLSTAADGVEAPGEAVTLSASQVTVPAEGTASVDVMLDADAPPPGVYGGQLTAAGGDGVLVTVPVGFTIEEPSYDLTVEALDADGQPVGPRGRVLVMDVEDAATFEAEERFEQGEATFRVPAGTYAVLGLVYTPGERPVQSALAAPEVAVDEATRVVLDARDAVEASASAVREDTRPSGGDVRLVRADAAGAIRHLQASFGGDTTLTVTPTDEVATGTFQLVTRWSLVSAEHDTARSPFVYDVAFVEDGAVPDELAYRVRPSEVTELRQRFFAHTVDGAEQEGRELRHLWLPGVYVDLTSRRGLVVPRERIDRVNQPDGAEWQQEVAINDRFPPFTLSEARGPVDPPARRRVSWFEQVVRPGAPAQGPPVRRRGGALTASFVPFVDDAGHFANALDVGADITLEAERDGEPYPPTNGPFGSFPGEPGPASYRLQLDVTRDVPGWRLSTHTSTAWGFDSSGDGPVPLMLPDYDVRVDLHNRMDRLRAGGRHLVAVSFGHPGIDDPPAVTDATVEASFDDGQTWVDARVLGQGAGGTVRARVPAAPRDGSGFVSLRVSATDADGGTVEQTVIRAYALPDR